MEYSTSKALLIGVGVFITLSITSIVIVIFGQVKDVYKQVYNTNISLKDRFGEFDKYNGSIMSGMDMYNTYKKYRNNPDVEVLYENSPIMIDDQGKIAIYNFQYDTKYRVFHNENDGKNIINFKNYNQ